MKIVYAQVEKLQPAAAAAAAWLLHQAVDGLRPGTALHLSETGNNVVHASQLRPSRQHQRPVRPGYDRVLPDVAVRRRRLRGHLHHPVLRGTAHRPRPPEGPPHRAHRALPGLPPSVAVPRPLVLALLRPLPPLRRRLPAGRGDIDGAARTRGKVGHRDSPGTVQGQWQPRVRVDLPAGHADRSPASTRPAVHVRQQHADADAVHDATVLRQPAPSRPHTAVPRPSRQCGRHGVRRRAGRRRHHQPAASWLRGGRVRAARAQRLPDERARRGGELSDVVAARSRHGLRRAAADCQTHLPRCTGGLRSLPLLLIDVLEAPFTLTYFAQSSKMWTATNGFDARLANRLLSVFDFRALRRSTMSARVPERQKLKMVGYTACSYFGKLS